jgi:hypothetical protein
MKNLLVLLLMCIVLPAFAQVEKPMKRHYLTGFAELSGQTGYGALYADFLLYNPNKHLHHAFAAGFTLYSYSLVSSKITIAVFPLQYNLLIGKSPNYFEIGTGFTVLSFPEYTIALSPLSPYAYGIVPAHETYMIAPRIGYRYQDINGGLFGRFSIVPLNLTWQGERIEPFLPVSISLGHTF